MDTVGAGSSRPWQVLLLGGASGVGKTEAGYRLARRLGVGVTEVDDFQALLERMTTPEALPAVHFWRTHPSPGTLAPATVVDHLLAHAEAMSVGLEAVIANHLETSVPVVLEGDFIHPALAARSAFLGQPNAGRVRAAFLYEPDERQLAANFLAREPDRGAQTRRAHVSRLHGERLKAEAELSGAAIVLARPWDTVLDRLLAAIG